MASSAPWYTSSNGGANWLSFTPQLVFGQFPLVGIWRDAHFPDLANGIVAGGSNFDDAYSIRRSDDGGLTWSSAYESGSGTWPKNFYDIDFPSPTYGYAVGTNGRFVRTSDGGATWTTQNSGTFQELRSVHFCTTNTGVIAGQSVLKRTVSAGVTWTDEQTVNGRFVLGGSGNDVVACGPAVVMVSTDAGATWVTRTSPATLVRTVHVFNASEFVVLDELTSKVYITHSGGQYWEELIFPIQDALLNDVYFLTPDSGCVVGRAGIQTSLIMTTFSGAGIGVPVVNITAESEAICGETSYTLHATGADPTWSLTWYRNGVVIGTGPDVQVTFYAPTGNTGIVLQADNSTNTGSRNWLGPVLVDIPFTLDAGPDQLLCAGGATGLGVDIPQNATVLWSPATGLNYTTIRQPTVSGLTGPVTYTATVTSGICILTDEVFIDVAPPIAEENWIPIYTAWEFGVYDFVDDLHGFVASDPGEIARTSDGGNTWTTRTVTSSTTFLKMVDAYYGYRTAAGLLYRTTDGWNTETQVPSTSFANCTGARYAYPKNRDTIIVYCEPLLNDGAFYRSVDQGYSWEQVYNYISPINDIEFLPGNVVLAGGGNGVNGRLHRSTDNGLTWGLVPILPEIFEIADIQAVVDGAVYAISASYVLRSFDLGLQWDTTFKYPSNSFLAEIGFQHPDTGFAYFNSGALYQTVNGSDCWQSMEPNLSPVLRGLSSVPGAGTFILSSEAEGRILYRNRMPPPGLGFTLVGDTVCFGTTPPIYNNSIGYGSFAWWLDGVLISTSAQLGASVLQSVPAGDHELLLIGAAGQNTDSASHAFHVQDPTVVPELSLLMDDCWDSMMVLINAETSVPVLGFQWYTVGGGGNYWPLYDGGSLLSITASANPDVYVARAITFSGCIGPYSDPISIPVLPLVNMPNGPSSVCLADDPVVSTFSTTTATSVVIDYQWDLVPPQAGIVLPNGTSCTVQWDPTFSGQATVRCSGVDTCGAGPYAVHNLTVNITPTFTQQPLPVFVDEGFPFTLQVVTNAPEPNSTWYRNGAWVASTSYTYSVVQASLADGGYYHWTGWSGITCGTTSSDTVLVTIVPSTGIDASAGRNIDALRARPVPFNGTLTLEVPELVSSARLWITDAIGRRVMEWPMQAAPAHTGTLDLHLLETGVYHVHLVGSSGRWSIPIIKAH